MARWSSRRSAVRPTKPPGSLPRHASCATRTSRSAGSGVPSTRCWKRCPAWACSQCCWSGLPGSPAGTLDPGAVVSVAYLLMVVAFPVRAIGWVLGELPRAAVGWRRVERVLRVSGALPYGDATLPDATDPADVRVRELSFAYVDDRDVLHGLTLRRRAGTHRGCCGSDRLRQVESGRSSGPARRSPDR